MILYFVVLQNQMQQRLIADQQLHQRLHAIFALLNPIPGQIETPQGTSIYGLHQFQHALGSQIIP
jgi:hypothetical protein